jgi:hypothetical protein
MSGGGLRGGMFAFSMVGPIQRDWPLCRGLLSGRTHAWRSSRLTGLRLSEGAMSITLYVVVLSVTWVPSMLRVSRLKGCCGHVFAKAGRRARAFLVWCWPGVGIE